MDEAVCLKNIDNYLIVNSTMKFSSVLLLGLSCVAPVLSSPAPAAEVERSLEKRYDNARMTYYEVGL